MLVRSVWRVATGTKLIVMLTMLVSLAWNSAFAGINDVLIKAAEYGEINSLRSALDNGADVNARMNDGMTPLMYASVGGHLEVARILIGLGADVNARTKDGVTSLMYSSLGGYQEIVRTLIAKGADVNAVTSDGKTVLMIASVGGHPEVVKHLLSNGARVEIESKTGLSALLIASTNGHKKVEELIKEAVEQQKDRVSAPSSSKPLLNEPHSSQSLPVAAGQNDTRSVPGQPDDSASIKKEPRSDPPTLQPEQENVRYTLSAGESVDRSKLASIVKKLKTAGHKPVVRKVSKKMDVYRLVAGCFADNNAAQKMLKNLVRKEKQAFIVKDGDRQCVVAASCFSSGAALTEQNKLATKDIQSEIVKIQVPLTTWKVTIGEYKDSQSAEADQKLCAKRGIKTTLVPVEM